MGIDIHVKIVRDAAIVLDIDMGRNYSWFSKIQNEENEYGYLNWQYNPEYDAIPQEVREDLDKGDWGFRFCNVAEFVDWFYKYKPNINAGWIRKKDAWLFNKKGIAPEDYYDELEEGCIVADWEFCEFPATDDCAEDIVKEIESRPFLNREHSYLVFYFDN